MGIFSDFALNYHELGYSVMPVKGKSRPVQSEFQNFSKTLPTEELMNGYIEKYPNHNIAIVLGMNDLICIDIDYDGEGRDVFLNGIKEICPPINVAKKGKKGLSIFYRSKLTGKKCKNPLDKTKTVVEILSVGNYTIMPPSIHPETMKEYYWETPDTLLDFSVNDLQVFEEYHLIKIKAFIESFFSKESKMDSGRNNFLGSYAIKICDKFKTIEDLTSKVMEKDIEVFKSNSYYNDPEENRGQKPFDFALSHVKRAVKFVKEKRKENGIEWDLGVNNSEDENKIKLEDYFSENDFEIYTEVVSEKGKVSYIPNYFKASGIFKRSKKFLFSGSKNLIYKNGHWDFFDKNIVDNIISQMAGIHINPFHLAGFLKQISADCSYYNKNFKSTQDLINLNNGILNIKTKELIQNSPDYEFMQVVNVEYNKESKCEKWIDFLNDIFDNDSERVLALQKIFGYILLGGRPFLQKAFVFTGSGRNGKGIVIAVLRSLLGIKSFSTVSMDNFNKSFSLVHLDGKLANIVEETPSTVNAEVFKNIVGGGFVTDSLKGKDQYSFRVQARLVFACNDIPKFEDKNVSILDRLFIIPFDKHYAEGVNLDPLLEEKIHDEISGILNWALDGANMVMASKIIEQPKISIELKDNYRRENDSAYDWFVDCCDISIDNNAVFNSVDHIYLNYRQWAEANGNGTLSKMSFSKRLQAILKQSGREIFKDGTVFRTIESKKYRGYYGIKITRVFIERDIFNKPMAILRIDGN